MEPGKGAKEQGKESTRRVAGWRLPSPSFEGAPLILRSRCQPIAGVRTGVGLWCWEGKRGASPEGGWRAEYRGERRACDQIFPLTPWQPSCLPLARFIGGLLQARSGGRGAAGAAHPACCSEEAEARAPGRGTVLPRWTLNPGYPSRRLYTPNTNRSQPAADTRAARVASEKSKGSEGIPLSRRLLRKGRESHSPQRMRRASIGGLGGDAKDDAVTVGARSKPLFKPPRGRQDFQKVMGGHEGALETTSRSLKQSLLFPSPLCVRIFLNTRDSFPLCTLRRRKRSLPRRERDGSRKERLQPSTVLKGTGGSP